MGRKLSRAQLLKSANFHPRVYRERKVAMSSLTKEGDYDPRHSPLRPLTSLSTKVHDCANHRRQFVVSMPLTLGIDDKRDAVVTITLSLSITL
jgi:hypothetical protein